MRVPEKREDAHVIVAARGEKSTLATGYGTSSQARMHPLAYHNPIFVDVDGGGFTPNGDLLDWPLPTKKPDLAEIKKQLAAHGLPDGPPPVKPVAP